jgi:hypothetical protein
MLYVLGYLDGHLLTGLSAGWGKAIHMVIIDCKLLTKPKSYPPYRKVNLKSESSLSQLMDGHPKSNRDLRERALPESLPIYSRSYLTSVLRNKNGQPLPGVKQFRRNQFSTSADFLFLLLFSKQLRCNQFLK